MSVLRLARPRVTTLAASALVVGCCLVAALRQTREWVGPARSANAHIVWPIVALLAALLSIPWFIVLRQAPGLGARGRRALLLCLAGYVATGLLLGGGLAAKRIRRSEFLPSWVVLAAGVGVLMAGVAMTAGRRRRSAAAATRRPRVRPAWPWAGAVLLAAVVPLVAWLAARNSNPPEPLPWNPPTLHGLPEVEPAGPFARLAAESAIGWFWVRGEERWRQAVVLQPPFRVVGCAPTASPEPLRLFVAVFADVLARRDVPIRVRCLARGDTGETVAECHRDLHVPPSGHETFGAWEPLELDLSSAAGDTVDLVLEAQADGADARDLPFVAVAAVPPEGPLSVSQPAGPNCVIILVDALRADRLHCYGYAAQTSPRIDRLATEGTFFEDAVSASSWTVPSVASLFTGTYVQSHRLTHFQTSAGLPFATLAEHFRKAGVRTAAVSANALVTPRGGFGIGFDEFYTGDDFQEIRPRAAWITDHAIDCLRRSTGRRFFLYVHYMDVHMPYDPPPGWNTFGEDAHGRYLGEIRYCDSEIGRLLDELDALGRSRDTLVVFLSDHGEAFGEREFHGRGYHGHGYTVHREEVQVPLILRWPDVVPAAMRVGARVASIDVHATIAELMGLPQPRHVEGESLVPLLRDDEPQQDRTVFSSVTLQPDAAPPQVCMYEGDHKLILLPDSGRCLLYNVSEDPEERSDLAVDEAGVAAMMERKIRAFLKQRSATSKPIHPMTAAERRLLESQGYLTPLTHPAVAPEALGRSDKQTRVNAER